MRDGIDATTLGLYLSGFYDLHTRVKIQNGSGTFILVPNRIKNVRLDSPNPDTPVGTMVIDLLREMPDGSMSMSPLVTTSALNKLDDGVTFSPFLEIGRAVKLEVALTAPLGERPADDGAWYEIYYGYMSKISWGKRDGHIASIRCYDLAGRLAKAKSEVAFTYLAGTPIETAMRQVLDNNGFNAIPLHTPTATGRVLQANYAPGKQKTVWDQLWSLAQSIAYVTWFRYITNVSKLTLFVPTRDKVTVDQVIHNLYDHEPIEVNEDFLFNVAYAQFTNASLARQDIGPVEDTVSIEQYGGIRRAFWINFLPDSPVRRADDALSVLLALISDTSHPDVTASSSMPAMVFAECAVDRYQFNPNPAFNSEILYLAPYSLSIQIGAEITDAKSSVNLRAKASAGYRYWKSQANANVQEDLSNWSIYDVLVSQPAEDGTAEVTWKKGPGVESMWVATRTYALPRLDIHWDDLETHLEHTTELSMTLPAPPTGFYTIGQIEAWDVDLNVSERARVILGERFTTPNELAVVEQAAADATLLAAGAQAAADGKITTFFEAEAPVAEGIGDLWMDIDDGNKLYRWDGSNWEQVQDQAIVEAILAALEAQETADGKIVSFYQNSTPTALGVGDVWIDLDDRNHLYRWNGSAWISVRDGLFELKVTTYNQPTPPTAAAVGDLWFDTDNGNLLHRWSGSAWISSRDAGIEAAIAAAGDAQSTADGKIDSFYQPTEPIGSVGDFWIDTNDGNKLYRHNGTVWVETQDAGIAQAIIDAAGAQATADGKITTFYQSGTPTASGVGDLWVKTDSNNLLHRWSGSAWVSVRPLQTGVRISSVTVNSAGTASVTINVEQDVATGLGAVQYQIDGGSWTDAVVGVGRSAIFDVTQTSSPKSLKVRGLLTIGNSATAGVVETGEIPLYIAPATARLSSITLTATSNESISIPESDWVREYELTWTVEAIPVGWTLTVVFFYNGIEVDKQTSVSPAASGAYFSEEGNQDGFASARVYLLNSVGGIAGGLEHPAITFTPI